MRHYRFYSTAVAAILLLTQSLHAQIITTNVGSYAAGYTYTGDGGPATAAGMKYTYSIVIDAAGNKYVGEGNRVVRKVNTAGIISTFAGNGTAGYSGDGGPATAAQFHYPGLMATDAAGNVYIADDIARVVRKVDLSGIITRFAGTGTLGFSGDGGPASSAQLNTPQGLAVDAAGNVYISDNNRIRKVSTAGIISTIAGTGFGTYTGDGGPASAATISFTGALTFDAAGNLYMCDRGNNVIRKINTAGIISTVAGNGFGAGMGSGFGGLSGDGGPATAAMLNDPVGIGMDSAGSIYITDRQNKRIRKVDPSGIISTFAGIGTDGYSGDNGPARLAQFNWPWGLTVDNVGRVYVVDGVNYVVRMIDTTSDNPPSFAGTEALSTCEDVPVLLNSYLGITDADAGQTETWSVISGPYNGTLTGFTTTMVSTGGMVTPTGLMYTPSTGFSGADSFSVAVSDGTIAIVLKKVVTVIPAASCPALTVKEVEESGLTVSPNPSYGSFTVQLPAGSQKITVTDCLGRTISVKDVFPGGAAEASYSDLPPGNYILTVATTDRSYKVKVAVQ